MSIEIAKQRIVEAKEKKLTTLDLGNCGLKKLPDLSGLEQVTILALSNRYYDYRQKKWIDSQNKGEKNQLPHLQGIEKLPQLQELYADNINLQNLHALQELKNLTWLNFSWNQVSDIRPLQELKNLTSLNLSRNQVSDISPLQELKNLTSLDFSRNLVRDIRPLQELKNLTWLYFYSNQVSDIRPLQNLIQIGKIDFYWGSNPLTNPPVEVVERGNKAILDYFESLEQADKEEFLYEAKLVIVGRGNVGKTTLVKKLTQSGFKLNANEATTKGIVVLGEPWQLEMSGLQDKEAFTLNIWDFGGQEKYDATHQFFITERTVYLFLADARMESNYLDYYYWLRTIELLGKDSPVIVVQTKIDERDKAMPEDSYRKRFKNIEAFVKISCADGYEHTLNNLKGYLCTAVGKLRQNKEKLSNRWVEVREHLQTLSKTEDCITYSKYLEICREHKIPDNQAQTLSGFLHDLGIIIHHQKDIVLKQTVIINPEWGVDGVYKVIDDPKTIEQHGSFSEEDLQRIWDEAKYQNKQSELLRLMQKFELCFEVTKGHYIAPELLSPNPPKNLGNAWETQPSLPYRYTYDFMPAGIMGRLIVKGHTNLYQTYYWKSGAVFQYQQAKALVTELYEEKKLYINLQGEAETCKELLAILRNHISAIHQQFDNLIVEEGLPCPCATCKGSEVPYFHSLEKIIKAESKGKRELECQESFTPVAIQQIRQAVYKQNSKEVGNRDSLIRKYVSENKLKEALDTFEEESHEIILLKRELSQCEAGRIQGTLKEEDHTRKTTDISSRILLLLENNHKFDTPNTKLDTKSAPSNEGNKIPTQDTPLPFYKRWWKEILGFLGVTAVLFGSLNDGFSVWDRLFTAKDTAKEAQVIAPKTTPMPIKKDSTHHAKDSTPRKGK